MKSKPFGDLDAAHYRKNSELQYSLARGSLEAYCFRGDEVVLDVGCGDGKITAQIAEKVPRGFVIGVDKSPAMIALANKSFPNHFNLRFEVQDATRLNLPCDFDLIVSFSCLHWVQPQQMAFLSMKKILKPSGKVMVLTYPRVATFWDPIESVAGQDRWRSYFTENPRPYHFLSEAQYRKSLPEIGLKVVQFETASHMTKFVGKKGVEEYIRGWLPLLIYLPKELHDQFLEEVGDASLKATPLKEDGYVYHPCETFVMMLQLNGLPRLE